LFLISILSHMDVYHEAIIFIIWPWTIKHGYLSYDIHNIYKLQIQSKLLITIIMNILCSIWFIILYLFFKNMSYNIINYNTKMYIMVLCNLLFHNIFKGFNTAIWTYLCQGLKYIQCLSELYSNLHSSLVLIQL